MRRDQSGRIDAGVEVDGAVGDGAWPAGEHQRGELLAARAGSGALHHVGIAVADVGELAAAAAAGALTGHAADRLGEAAVVDAVQHHLGDRDLAVERLAARLEVDRLGQALPARRRRRRAASHRALAKSSLAGRRRPSRAAGLARSSAVPRVEVAAGDDDRASAERAIGRIDCERARTRAPAEESRAACSEPIARVAASPTAPAALARSQGRAKSAEVRAAGNARRRRIRVISRPSDWAGRRPTCGR